MVLSHYIALENQILVPPPPHFGLMQSSDIPNHLPSFPFQYSSSNQYVLPLSSSSSSSPSCFTTSSTTTNNSSSTTSDEADHEHDYQLISVIDERKQRRMISNRESARRSRLRKKKHMDELWSQVLRLRNENHELVDKLNHVFESHDKVLQENARLKKEASDLHQLIAGLRIGTCFDEEFPCKTSNQQSLTSVDMLLK